MAAQYSQQTKTVCTNTDDITCQESQKQYDDMNMLQAQLKADSEYDVPPSQPPKPAQTITITQGFTTLQSTSMGLFVAAALFIIYGCVSKRRK